MKKIEKNSLLRISLILFAIMPLLSKAQSTQGSGAMPNIAIPAAGTGGADHVFIGSNAGKVNIGDRNTFMGTGAGRFNYDQYDNVFIGFNAGFNNGNGDTEPKAMLNTFVGSQCGFSNTLGGNNTFLGFKAGYTNTLGDANTYLGTNAGFAGTGYSNVCVGWQSGFSNTADYN
ncbi:MAG TPA: hypothetical protein VK826_18750, partial [Bacteroidia bacterium]|nr:hypothetical protein [Bacteroidia bacterium]